MQFLGRSAVILPVIASMSLFLASCGSSKVDECNKLLQVGNKDNGAANTTAKNDKLDSKATFKQADEADRKVKGIEAVEVKDEKLKEFKSRFISVYKEESASLRDAAKAAAAAEKVANKTDSASIDITLKSADKYLKTTDVYNKQLTLISDVTTYCTK